MTFSKTKKVIFAFMALIFILSVSVFGLSFTKNKAMADDQHPFAGGDGSEQNPYKIATAEQFIALSSLGTWQIPSNSYFELIDDIDLSGYSNWTPIGNNFAHDQAWFASKLNGAEYVIKNFNVVIDSESTTLGQNFGLFGKLVDGAVIKNLGIESGSVEINNTEYSMVGSLVGENQGAIINCYSNITLECLSDTDIGGLVGQNSGTIKDCYNSGDILYSMTYATIGGIAAVNSSSIDNCYNTGNLSATATGNIVGGIVGHNSGNVKNCYSTGAIKGDVYVGGIAGFTVGIISSCYSIGDIEGYLNVGGIAGKVDSGALHGCIALNGKVSGSVDVGRVTGNDAGGMSNNYAFENMLNKGNNTNWDNRDHNTKNGLDFLANHILADGTIGGLFVGEVWTTQNGKLPGMLGQVVDIPQYIMDAVTKLIRTGDSVSMADWTYGETASEPVSGCDVGQETNVTYEYEGTGSTVYAKSATKPTNAGTYKVIATFEETNDYISSTAEATFEILKATPTVSAPTGLIAKVGQKLSDIALPANFSWKDGTISVGEAGTRTFKADYNPDPDNYNTIEVDITISVTEVTSPGGTDGSNEGGSNVKEPGNGATIAIITSCIALACLGAVLMIVFISKRRKQKLS